MRGRLSRRDLLSPHSEVICRLELQLLVYSEPRPQVSAVSPVQKPVFFDYPLFSRVYLSQGVENLKREFIMMPEFDRQWKDMGLTDEDLKVLQFELLNEPTKAPVVKGTGGLRKVRVGLPGRGKSGSACVAYVVSQYLRLSTSSQHILRVRRKPYLIGSAKSSRR